MDRRKDIGIIGTIVAVIVAVVGVSIIWAVYTSNLTIKGSATAENAKWSVIFKDLSTVTAGNSQAGITSTATEVTSPEIVGSTSIESFSVSVKTPGDYVSYKFTIKNDGSFPAKISDSFSMPGPTCSGSNGTTYPVSNMFDEDIIATPLNYGNHNSIAKKVAGDSTTGNNSGPSEQIGCNTSIDLDKDECRVCTNLTYTLNYTDGTQVKAGDTFDAGEEKEVILKLTYNENIDANKLPRSNVVVGNLSISISFEQA